MTLLMNEWTYIVMDDGWVYLLAKTATFSCEQLAMKYFHGWLNIGWELTWEAIVISLLQIYDPPKIEKEWQIMSG